MSSDQIRKSIALVEGATDNKINLQEKMPMGFLKTLVTGVSSLFSDIAAGELQAGQAANQWYRYYLQYLGKIGVKPNASTIGDLFTFLVDNGIKPQFVFSAVTKGMNDSRVSIKNINDVKKFWNTAITSNPKVKISNTLLFAIQNHMKTGSADIAPEDLMKQAQVGARIVAQTEQGALSSTTPPETTAEPTTTITVSANTPAALGSLINSDPAKATQLVDKMLKYFGETK